MSTKYKIRDPQGLYFMTCTIVGWIDIFTRQGYRDIVLDSWRFCQGSKGFRIHAFVIMSNHLHLVTSCEAPFNLEDVTRDWKAHTAREILKRLRDVEHKESRREWILDMFQLHAANKRGKQECQVWQHENHPIPLYSDQVIEQKIKYIHLNPVRAGFVSLAEDWLYSSAVCYAGRPGLIPVSLISPSGWKTFR